MLSNVLLLAFVALGIQTTDSLCVTRILADPIFITTTTTTPLVVITSYHPCPRSMKNYLNVAYNIAFRCDGGSENNQCSDSAMCNTDGDTTHACCQQENGCKACVGNEEKIILYII
jgi:hypothetical protein